MNVDLAILEGDPFPMKNAITSSCLTQIKVTFKPPSNVGFLSFIEKSNTRFSNHKTGLVVFMYLY